MSRRRDTLLGKNQGDCDQAARKYRKTPHGMQPVKFFQNNDLNDEPDGETPKAKTGQEPVDPVPAQYCYEGCRIQDP